MPNRNITSVDSVITLSIDTIFAAPQRLQGYAAEDIYDAEDIDSAELSMGLDGILSAGFIPKEIPWSFTLQADSASNDMMDTWYNSQQQARAVYRTDANIWLPSLGRKWVMTRGVLTKYSPMPAGKKVLQPRKFTITFEALSSAQS